MSFSFFKETFKEVSFSVNERIKNPYWFSFLILLLYYNWENLITIFNLEEFNYLEKKIAILRKLNFKIIKPLLYAFIGVIAFYIVQYMGLAISVLFQDRFKPYLFSVISSKRIATIEKVSGLRKVITGQNSQISDLEKQLSQIQSKNQQEIKNLLKEVYDRDLENKRIRDSEESLTEVNKSMENREVRLNDEIDALNKDNVALNKVIKEKDKKISLFETDLFNEKRNNNKLQKELILVEKYLKEKKEKNRLEGIKPFNSIDFIRVERLERNIEEFSKWFQSRKTGFQYNLNKRLKKVIFESGLNEILSDEDEKIFDSFLRTIIKEVVIEIFGIRLQNESKSRIMIRLFLLDYEGRKNKLRSIIINNISLNSKRVKNLETVTDLIIGHVDNRVESLNKALIA